jgi:hypothetical protein
LSEPPELTSDKDEMTEAMLAIGAVFAGLEKKRLVKKLRAARDRKSQEKGHRIEGRPPLMPLHQRFPEAVAMHIMASQYRNKDKGSGRAHREKGDGCPFNHATIKAMIEGPMPSIGCRSHRSG